MAAPPLSTPAVSGTRAPTRVPTSLRWPRWLPIAAVFGAACCWGTQGIAFALILNGIVADGFTIVTLRAATATLLLWIWLALTNRGALRVPRADLPLFALLGITAVAIFYPALFFAYAWTGVAVGTVLLYLAPALVTLGAAVFLCEALTFPKLAALGLTFAGTALVVQVDQPANLLASMPGILVGLIAAAGYASYSLLGKRLLRSHGSSTVLAFYLLIGTLVLVAVKLVISPATWPAPHEAVMIGLVTGVGMTLVPIALFTFGLTHLPSSEATTLLTLEPVVAVALAGAVLGESLHAGQWLGAIAVLGGVLLLAGAGRSSFRRVRTRPRHLQPSHADGG